jgi:hypothetical protein
MGGKVDRRTVDLLGYPDLVVIYLGMRANTGAGIKTLGGFGPQIGGRAARRIAAARELPDVALTAPCRHAPVLARLRQHRALGAFRAAPLVVEAVPLLRAHRARERRDVLRGGRARQPGAATAPDPIGEQDLE